MYALKTSNHNWKWLDSDGKPLTCEEKVKVLNENMEEIEEVCRNAMDDAVLMGCQRSSFRKALMELVDKLTSGSK